MLVERLDHVAAAIGSGSGRACRVHEADDVLERGDGVPMVDRKDTPPGGHKAIFSRHRVEWPTLTLAQRAHVLRALA